MNKDNEDDIHDDDGMMQRRESNKSCFTSAWRKVDFRWILGATKYNKMPAQKNDLISFY